MTVTETAAPRSLRDNRDYVSWWLGNVASNTGSQVSMVALPLMVLWLSHSAVQAGLVGSCEALPYIVLSLPAGVLVDRLPRRPLLLGASLVSMAAFATIPLTAAVHELSMAQVYGVAFVSGCATVVFAVAQQAALPVLVSDAYIGQAAGQAETVERLAAILGPPLGAFLFQSVWPSAPFVLDAASFGVIALMIVRIRTELGPVDPPSGLPKSDLLLGARSLLGNKLLRDLTCLNSAGDLLFAGIGLVMIILVRSGTGDELSVGVVFSCAAVGGLLGSLVANRLEQRLGLATAVIGKHVLCAALFPVLLLHLPSYGIGLLWACVSFQVSVVGVIQRKYVMLTTSPELMGRVQSFTTFLSFGSLPVGTAMTGLSLGELGARPTLIVYSAVLVALALASIASRAIRTARRQKAEV